MKWDIHIKYFCCKPKREEFVSWTTCFFIKRPFKWMIDRQTMVILAWVFHKRIFLRFYYFIFRERRKKGERERNFRGWEKHWLVASRTPPADDLACNPGTRPDWESNWHPFGLQAYSQSTEAHQTGLTNIFFKNEPSELSLLEKQMTVFVTNNKIKAFKPKLEFWKSCIYHHERWPLSST